MGQFCPNCGHKIGCSCSGGSSTIKAVDGKTICTACKSSYEAKLKIPIIKNES